MPVGSIATYDTVSDLQAGPVAADTVYLRGYHAAGDRGGGLLHYLDTTTASDGFMIFKDGTSPGANRRFKRDLSGKVVDAYMAGAKGTGAINGSGVISGDNDSAAIQAVLDYLKAQTIAGEAQVAKVAVNIGNGVFRSNTSLNLTSGASDTALQTAHGWLIDGVGATILGTCQNQPVVDMTGSRFGTISHLQVCGGSGSQQPSCGKKGRPHRRQRRGQPEQVGSGRSAWLLWHSGAAERGVGRVHHARLPVRERGRRAECLRLLRRRVQLGGVGQTLRRHHRHHQSRHRRCDHLDHTSLRGG